MNIDEQVLFNIGAILQATFTASAVTQLLTSNGHGFSAGDKIRVSSGTTLPTGLSAATDYYVINPTTNTFQVSATLNGVAVTIGDAGTGTHTLVVKSKIIMTEGYQHIKLRLSTTGNTTATIKVQGSTSFNVPNFSDAATTANFWAYKQLKNEDDASTVNGGTGVALTGTDINKQYEVNVNSARWICLEISGWSAGKLGAYIHLAGKFNN